MYITHVCMYITRVCVCHLELSVVLCGEEGLSEVVTHDDVMVVEHDVAALLQEVCHLAEGGGEGGREGGGNICIAFCSGLTCLGLEGSAKRPISLCNWSNWEPGRRERERESLSVLATILPVSTPSTPLTYALGASPECTKLLPLLHQVQRLLQGPAQLHVRADILQQLVQTCCQGLQGGAWHTVTVTGSKFSACMHADIPTQASSCHTSPARGVPQT